MNRLILQIYLLNGWMNRPRDGWVNKDYLHLHHILLVYICTPTFQRSRSLSRASVYIQHGTREGEIQAKWHQEGEILEAWHVLLLFKDAKFRI